jgi:hypothetical protein
MIAPIIYVKSRFDGHLLPVVEFHKDKVIARSSSGHEVTIPHNFLVLEHAGGNPQWYVRETISGNYFHFISRDFRFTRWEHIDRPVGSGCSTKAFDYVEE